jgi:hypothetical protein
MGHRLVFTDPLDFEWMYNRLTGQITHRGMLNSRWTFTLDLSTYKNDHQAGVKKLVDANRKGKPLPEPKPEPAKTKVVNIMDALRSSLAQGKKLKTTARKTSQRSRPPNAVGSSFGPQVTIHKLRYQTNLFYIQYLTNVLERALSDLSP